ncbi:MAG: diacylglycerol kinase family protein [Eggerthellaceae bacterium]|nr:diacylglycerol kinase family protein [Eggerthellaceae bacterium]
MTPQSFLDSFRTAGAGIVHALVTGRNFKIELGFAVAAIILGLALGISLVEWAVVCVCIGVVLGAECANTALETLVDLVSPEYNELARITKDCAAGAVLINAIAALFVAAFIFLPKMLALVGLI